LLILKFLTALTAVHFRDRFCIIRPNTMEIGHNVAYISQFSRFLVKYKHSVDDRDLYGTMLSKLKIIE